MNTKANRKFVRDDKGISAVIAMILIVAITVALIAVAYAWVNGFIPTGSSAAKIVQLQHQSTNDKNNVTFSVESADAGIQWDGITITATDANGVNTNMVRPHASGGTDANWSFNPADAEEMQIGQTLWIDCDDTWTGSYTFRLIFEDKTIYTSSDISLG